MYTYKCDGTHCDMPGRVQMKQEASITHRVIAKVRVRVKD